MEMFLDINGNEIRVGDKITILDGGEKVARGKVTEIDDMGVVVRSNGYNGFPKGEAICIDISDVVPNHFRKESANK